MITDTYNQTVRECIDVIKNKALRLQMPVGEEHIQKRRM
jgi:hypothetical protein